MKPKHRGITRLGTLRSFRYTCRMTLAEFRRILERMFPLRKGPSGPKAPEASSIRTVHAENGPATIPLTVFPTLATLAATPPVAIAAGERILSFARVLAEISAGGGTFAMGVAITPVAPPGPIAPIDITETTVIPGKATLTTAGALTMLPAGTYIFSIVAAVTGTAVASVIGTGGPGYPIAPATMTLVILSPE